MAFVNKVPIFFCGIVLAIVFAGCVPPPRVIPISVPLGYVRPSGDRIADYPEAMTTIISVMVDTLNLPSIDATLILYPNNYEFESGLIREFKYDAILAAQTARFATGVGGCGKKIVVDETRLSRMGWHDRIRFLAHEYTHVVDCALAEPRRVVPDTWIREGFADWVSYKVLESLGLDTYAQRRKLRVEQVWRVKQSRTLPSISQLRLFRDWVTWTNTLGSEATYAQAFLAVEYLVERKGVPSFVRYFGLFRYPNSPLINFTTAFDERLTEFEQEFGRHLENLLR